MSSLLISRIGQAKVSKGTKKRKLNDGEVEEEKKDDPEDEEIEDLSEDVSNAASQFQRSKTMNMNGTDKVIGTRKNKKRQYDHF